MFLFNQWSPLVLACALTLQGGSCRQRSRTPPPDASPAPVPSQMPAASPTRTASPEPTAKATPHVASTPTGDDAKTQARGSKAVETLKTGTWGGPHARLDVTASGATVEFDCANGAIDAPFYLNADGRFDARGTLTEESAGPAHDISAVNEDEPAPTPGGSGGAARYTGQVAGQTMTLTVTLAANGRTLGPFNLTHGATPRLFKCQR
jgi:hypothetical protein